MKCYLIAKYRIKFHVMDSLYFISCLSTWYMICFVCFWLYIIFLQAIELSYLWYCDTAKPVKRYGTWKTSQICNKIDLKYGFIIASSRNISSVEHKEFFRIDYCHIRTSISRISQIFLTTFLTQGTPVFNCQQVPHFNTHVQNADVKKNRS